MQNAKLVRKKSLKKALYFWFSLGSLLKVMNLTLGIPKTVLFVYLKDKN